MEALALPVLAGSLVMFALFGLLVSLRHPPTFWMDERRLPKRHVRGRSVDASQPPSKAG